MDDMEPMELSPQNIAYVQDKQDWLIKKLQVALANRSQSEIQVLKKECHTIEKRIERLRIEFYRQLVSFSFYIKADFPEKERREIKDRGWQDWRNRYHFQTWQQMIVKALENNGLNPNEIIRKQKLVEQWLKASERKKDEAAQKSQNKIIKGISDLKKDINSIAPHAKRGLKVLNAAAQGGREASKLQESKRTEIKQALKEYISKPENKHLSLTTCRKNIAKHFDVSRRSIERYTKGINKK